MNNEGYKSVRNNQSRISNNDRNQKMQGPGLRFGKLKETDMDRFEKNNRQNWIAVLTFIGVIFVIVLLIILL